MQVSSFILDFHTVITSKNSHLESSYYFIHMFSYDSSYVLAAQTLVTDLLIVLNRYPEKKFSSYPCLDSAYSSIPAAMSSIKFVKYFASDSF